MTTPLAARVGRVIAVEIDRDLAAILRNKSASNVEIVPADFLDVDLEDLLRSERKPVRVVGNLPYNVSSPILFKLLRAAREGQTLSEATLMLQKEVADRLAARPGSRDYGVLAIQVALFADVERVLTLPPGAFRPPPKVMSAVVGFASVRRWRMSGIWKPSSGSCGGCSFSGGNGSSTRSSLSPTHSAAPRQCHRRGGSRRNEETRRIDPP